VAAVREREVIQILLLAHDLVSLDKVVLLLGEELLHLLMVPPGSFQSFGSSTNDVTVIWMVYRLLPSGSFDSCVEDWSRISKTLLKNLS